MAGSITQETLKSVSAGLKTASRIAEKFIDDPSPEITMSHEELVSIFTGYSECLKCFELLYGALKNQLSDETEAQEIMSYIARHKDAFKTLMRRCGIW